MPLHPTQYPEVNDLLAHLLWKMKSILGDKLVGLYLYGSLVWGDFDLDISDIDLLATTTTDINKREFAALQQMHREIAGEYKRWDDRIEVQYLSVDGLRTFKTRSSKMGVISPGEPFHIVEAGNEWLMNWYLVREKGVVLAGPPPETIIAPVSKEEFMRAAVEHGREWRDWVTHAMDSRPYQSYGMLTVCRALYAQRHGEQVSKKQAAAWAAREYPELAPMLQKALEWRAAASTERDIDHTATYPKTERFIHYVVDRLLVKPVPGG
jgi:predicted nucleotidyltransferase